MLPMSMPYDHFGLGGRVLERIRINLARILS